MDKIKLPEHSIFEVVAEAAAELGIDAYVIGGFVRDLVLKRPSKDIDVVCVGDGIALATTVALKLPHKPKVSIFKNFGTAMLRDHDWEVEFVGARKESYREHSRKPEVETGTLDDDLKRRDFTINALGISLNKQNYGELIDEFGGLKDMKRQIIRTPLEPGITFSDDPLRMMRAIRFASQLGFDIDPDTFDAIIDYKERIKIVSQERIIDELNKIILSPKPSYGFKLLFASGLLHLIFPKMVELQGVETINGNTHKDNFYHTLQVLDNVAEVSDDLWLRWAAIMHDIAKPDTKRYHPKAGWTFHGHEDRGARMLPKLFRDLKLPLNEHMKFVQKLVRLHLRPIALVKETVTDSAIRRLLFEAGDDIDALMKLCRADITSKNDTKVKRYLQNFDKVEKRLVEVEESDKMRNFQPVITGEIIMETFNLMPSKTVGELKEVLTEAILEGKVKNEFNAAYAFLLKEGEKRGLSVASLVSPSEPDEEESKE
ncbi:putative nucleotidyltransferase with HDIG domain [Pontibacter aydingkolensis]|uniref:CCA tRNA nucleotidyltransferase n=1 Tax=Pontibacter aydingkolensis TaxID=1911536 RepID=A0ABS7CY28_9BACT|nr:HD domain-containing protein [Pontibacter aydingkolensis]MBW7468768.1 CCA tRNA nucleotidyltransferase [Pontibacter aydingkolensis]